MLRTWARTKILGTNVHEQRVRLSYFEFSAGFPGKHNNLFLILASLRLQVPCTILCLLTLWQPESGWIVREEWLFILPTCCHCGFDCLSRQHGPRHGHSRAHTVAPVDGHSFWQDSQMALQGLCGPWPSEGVTDCVFKGLGNITAERGVGEP